MDKKSVVTILNEIAVLLELAGENPFKSRSYTNVARQLEQIDEDIETLVEEKRLREIKGVGDALEEKITELVSTGKLKYYEDLKKKFPETLFELFDIPGLGAKRIKQLYDELHVKSMRDLEKAVASGKVAGLEGFGKKMQEKIEEGIGFVHEHTGQHLIDKARENADALLAYLKKDNSIIRIDVAGSIRRHKEVVKDIDVIVSSKKPKPLMQRFVEYEEVASVRGHGETKSSVALKSGMQADIRIVSDKEFPYALLYFTGSKEHNVRLRQIAKERDLKLNEYGLFKGEKNIPCKDEAAIYAKLDLPYFPPELREDMGEFEADELPDLVTEDDFVGMFHCHSTYSDGKASIENMAKGAKERGFKYITMTDHSQSAQYAGGLTPDDVEQQHAEIEKVNKKLTGITILKGIESDILKNGSLDYKDDVLATFDLVIASVHAQMNMSEKDATKRLVKAVENEYTTILGHPTGRLLLSRDGYPLDYETLFDACVANNVAVEINGNARRLDLDWRYVKRAKEKGVMLVVGPDAHSVDQLDNIWYGLGIARKGWLEKDDLLNCMTLRQFRAWQKK